jgi:hypothetical protein
MLQHAKPLQQLGRPLWRKMLLLLSRRLLLLCALMRYVAGVARWWPVVWWQVWLTGGLSCVNACAFSCPVSWRVIVASILVTSSVGGVEEQ